MANDAIPPARVIDRLLDLTREGRVTWGHHALEPAGSFELQTQSTNASLFKGDDGDRVGLQIRAALPQPDEPDEFGHIDPALLFGSQISGLSVDRGRVTIHQPPRVTVWSDDADPEIAGLVRALYDEVTAQATVSNDPFARLWSDLTAFGTYDTDDPFGV